MVASGVNALMCAPTGSGKTLAAFLWAIDRLLGERLPAAKARCRILYISPLKALTVDVDRNLRAPLRGISLAAARAGVELPLLSTQVRSGDTPAAERRHMQREPPDILITTPESLFPPPDQRGQEILTPVRAVILDEVHALAGGKRGAHLALSLERLEALGAGQLQRIGLSATVQPVDEVARFPGRRAAGAGGRCRPGQAAAGKGGGTRRRHGGPRARGGGAKPPGRGDRGRQRAAPAQHLARHPPPPPGADPGPPLDDHLRQLPAPGRAVGLALNELAAPGAAATASPRGRRRGHGTDGIEPGPAPPARRQRTWSAPTTARSRASSGSRSRRRSSPGGSGLVATSSLELGIDMGAVDLVIQVEAPNSVASGIQRIGRAGHSVGEPSVGVVFPKHRGDLLEAAVVVERMLRGIEAIRTPRNPVDILAQQLVAMSALDT